MLALEPPVIRRTFTVDQANAALPLVKAIIGDVMTGERKVRHLRFRLKFIRRGGDDIYHMFADEIQALEQELLYAERELAQHIEELLSLGIEPDAPAIGVVDFPCEQEGETVFLCWRYGESSVEFWHSLTGGFPNREPLKATVSEPWQNCLA
ncbi:MAG: DUF2203 domain-containing protein [Pirellulaceae bacterium]|nr:DUF2203 domain-containing protein [Pirellulaceae bacterium]